MWAIDAWHQPLYLFPRDCPRILVWPGPRTTDEDRRAWWGNRDCRMIAHMEWGWWRAMSTMHLYRYELPADHFIALDDAGMFASRDPVEPCAVEKITDLPGALASCGVELRLMLSLAPLANI